jgi:large repetitive protein
MVGGVLGLAAASLWAVTPLAAPSRVSSCATCRQETPAVAGAPSGDFLVLWEGQSAKDTRGIDGRLFKGATATPATADFQVNKNLLPDQYDAAVTRDNKGNYIAVWSEVANGNSDIMAQRYQATGKALGAPFKVNVDPVGLTAADSFPAIARTNDGGFVVVWISLLPPGSTPDKPQVMARRFNAAGAALGAQAKLNTGLVLGERPDVCVDTSGKIIAVWTNADAFIPFQPSKLGISMRRLSPAGTALAGEEVILAPAGNYMQPAISCGTGSTFVVVWHTERAPAQDGTDIVGQRFSRLHRKVGAAFRINTTLGNEQRNPAISTDSKGNFVVVWQESTGTNLGIFGRRFTPAGAPSGAQFEVVTDLHPPLRDPRVAHIGTTGNFVVVWSADRVIFGRRFAP